MKVLALTKYGDLAASTRQRFMLYKPAMAQAGIDLQIAPLLDNDYLARALVGLRPAASSVLKAYLRRLRSIAAARSADVIWLHCEFLPYWPGLAETLAARIVGKPIVFDFDDAIFHMYDDSAPLLTRLMLKGKLDGLLARAAACTCGNGYLRDYVVRHCPRSLIVPTVVDTDAYRPVDARRTPLTIGWIGSPSTWRGVQPILPQLRAITAATGARFLVVGAGRAAEADIFPGMEYRDWTEASEIADVQAMDIGIMPLLDRPFERGKSGYKLIQYMACGLPVVASPVGVNAEIVKDGVNGFLASTDQQWSERLGALLEDAALRRRMGSEGREQAVAGYSLASQAPRLVELFQSLG